jgi:hypothetical protein
MVLKNDVNLGTDIELVNNTYFLQNSRHSSLLHHPNFLVTD